jgi:hypothetical protein
MPNSVFSQFMLDVKAAADAVPGLVAAQNIVGHVEFHRHQEFYRDVAENGYYLLIGMPEGQADLVNYEGDFELPCELVYPIPSDESNSFIAAYDMIAKLVGAWATYGPWTRGSNRSPVRVAWEKPEIKTHEKPFIVSTRFILRMNFIADQCAAPDEEPKP